MATAAQKEAFLNKYHQAFSASGFFYKIPVSIITGQAALESDYGTSDVATKANNLFGVHADSSWKGPVDYFYDNGKLVPFRKYADPNESIVDHGKFLRDNQRYKNIFTKAPNDYKGVATELKAAGYAESDTYAQDLISTIESNNFNTYDLTPGQTPTLSEADQKGLLDWVGKVSSGQQAPAYQYDPNYSYVYDEGQKLHDQLTGNSDKLHFTGNMVRVLVILGLFIMLGVFLMLLMGTSPAKLAGVASPVTAAVKASKGGQAGGE